RTSIGPKTTSLYPRVIYGNQILIVLKTSMKKHKNTAILLMSCFLNSVICSIIAGFSSSVFPASLFSFVAVFDDESLLLFSSILLLVVFFSCVSLSDFTAGLSSGLLIFLF